MAHPHAAVASGGGNVNLMQCGNLYLVFDYIEVCVCVHGFSSCYCYDDSCLLLLQHDLAGLIDVRYRFNSAEIQSLMRQLFEVRMCAML